MEIVLELVGFKGDGVILRDLSGRDILWPKDSFPEDIEVGERVNFLLGAKELDDLRKQQTAKDILNELINSDN
jgi:hypothetical protein